MERKHVALSHKHLLMTTNKMNTDADMDSSSTSNPLIMDEEDIESPEPIAILTFGLLLKLAHASSNSIDNDSWTSRSFIKDFALEAVSVANDDCDAFFISRKCSDQPTTSTNFPQKNIFDFTNSLRSSKRN